MSHETLIIFFLSKSYDGKNEKKNKTQMTNNKKVMSRQFLHALLGALSYSICTFYNVSNVVNGRICGKIVCTTHWNLQKFRCLFLPAHEQQQQKSNKAVVKFCIQSVK